jgi:hypothetical protein
MATVSTTKTDTTTWKTSRFYNQEDQNPWTFENRVLMKICGRGYSIQELHDLYVSPIIRVIKSRKMRWVEHVAGMGKRRCVYGISSMNPARRTAWKASSFENNI